MANIGISDYEPIIIAVVGITSSDAFAFSESNNISITESTTDSATLTESTSIVVTALTVDSTTLSELSSFSADDLAQDSVSASDFSLSIATTAITTDSALLTESSQSIQLSRTDSGTLTEINSIAINTYIVSYDSAVPISSASFPSGTTYPSGTVYPLAPNFAFDDVNSNAQVIVGGILDTFTLDDLSELNEKFSSDSFNFSENNKTVSIASTDSAYTLSELSSFSAEDLAQDSISASDFSLPIEVTVVSTDSALLTESSQEIQLSITDSATLIEISSASATPSSSDSSTLSETDSYTSPTSTSDTSTLSEISLISSIAESTIDSSIISELDSISADLVSYDSTALIVDSIFGQVETITSDSIAVTEFSSLDNNATSFDSILLIDFSSIVNAIDSADSANFFDQNLGISLSSADLFNLQEFINSIDTGYRSESATLSEQDTIETTLSSSDTTYQLFESISFSAEDLAQDSGSVTDQSSIAADLSTSDSFSLVENTEIQLSSNESANLNDSSVIAVSISSSDQATLIENQSSIAVEINTTETVTLAENNNITAVLATADTGILNETLFLQNAIASTDSGTTIDQKDSIALASMDSGSLSEIVSSIAINSKDSSSLIEGTQTTLTSKDASVFLELTSEASANVSSEELSSLLEIINNIGLLTDDSSAFGEFNKTIGNNSKDAFSFIGESAFVSDLKTSKDSISFNELVTTTGLNVFQLISFKEGRIGIRKAASLTFNINGSATVHGVVTGDPVSISLSAGTVPILL